MTDFEHTVAVPACALYLLPVTLTADGSPAEVLPAPNLAVMTSLRHFIVENVRTARRFLRRCSREIDIDALTFYELNGHTPAEQIASYLSPLSRGESVGVLSEAGCPAVADPGADVVAIAQQRGYAVVPLVGPSSILMGLMASGLNGQSFAFAGYLPIDERERLRRLHVMQQRIANEGQTQIFIETPYRNDALLSWLLQHLPNDLRLCVATDITGPSQRIVTRTVGQWRHTSTTIGKVPTIFLLYR